MSEAFAVTLRSQIDEVTPNSFHYFLMLSFDTLIMILCSGILQQYYNWPLGWIGRGALGNTHVDVGSHMILMLTSDIVMVKSFT